MIKGIIFDLDGVIVDTENNRFRIIKELLKKRSIDLPKKLFNDYIGNKTRIFLQKHFSDKLTKKDIEKIAKDKDRLWYRFPRRYIKPVKGIKNLCRNLSKDHILAVATASNKKQMDIALDTIGIDEFFTHKLSIKDKPKPHPDVYIRAIKKLNIDKKEIIAIEDSPLGIMAAKKAGLICIGITTYNKKKELKEAGADYIIKELKEVTKILQNIKHD